MVSSSYLTNEEWLDSTIKNGRDLTISSHFEAWIRVCLKVGHTHGVVSKVGTPFHLMVHHNVSHFLIATNWVIDNTTWCMVSWCLWIFKYHGLLNLNILIWSFSRSLFRCFDGGSVMRVKRRSAEYCTGSHCKCWKEYLVIASPVLFCLLAITVGEIHPFPRCQECKGSWCLENPGQWGTHTTDTFGVWPAWYLASYLDSIRLGNSWGYEITDHFSP